MKKLRRVVTTALTLFVSFALTPVAFAHPLGNFTINQYAGLTISRGMIQVDYVVDMAEIPAFQELAPFDTDGDRQPDSPPLQQYPADKCASLQPTLHLILNDKPLTLTPTASSVTFPVGVGGLPTLRLTCGFQVTFDSTNDTLGLSFVNNAFPDRLGWKEVVVLPDGVSLQGEYSTTSLSNRLTNYPQDLLNSPPDQRKVEIRIQPVALPAQSQQSAPETETVPSLADRNDEFTRLILLEEITFPALLLALAVSFLWGAAHAMTPGHGKTIVGAYLVGSRGTVRHALYLGLTTTITHTLGVFALGLITLFAAQYIVPEKLFPWLSLLSGLFVVGIGLNLFVERFRSSGLGNWIISLDLLRKSFRHRERRENKLFSKVSVDSVARQRITYARDQFKTKLSGSPKYVLSSAGNMENAAHSHKFALRASHNHPHPRDHAHHHDPSHDHGHDYHDHDHADHSHTPPEAITWRSLLALGVSGGLIPCPSALVVLLGAIALNKIGLGLILVLAFSLGLAGALTAIGITFIYAGKLFERFPASGKVIGVLPAFSALFISLIGVGIVVKALTEIGV